MRAYAQRKNTMAPISTLSEFLLQAGTEYRAYDIGRGIRWLPNQTFINIEHGIQPYPYPRQGHAWLGIVFWNKNLSNEHYIWFLKLALDETSTLIAGPRDHFLQLVVEALDKETNNTSDTLSKVENPYSFTPNQQTLADFNALTKASLKLAPSQYYREAKQFFSAPAIMDWRQLATQGLSDFCSRLAEDNNSTLLVQSYPQLVPAVQNVLLACLENYQLSEQLVLVLVENAESSPADANLTALTLRALAQSQHHQIAQDYIFKIAKSKRAREINILSVLVARHWQLFTEETTLIHLLGHAAAVSTDVCIGLYKDLVMIPVIRQSMLNILNREIKDKVLSICLTQLKREFIK